MKISSETVDELDTYVDERLDDITALVNDARRRLGEAFDEDVTVVSKQDVRDEMDDVLADGDRALNLAALYRVGVELEVREDYAGFVVDELIGRRIAATLVDSEPETTLAEATFHYVDVYTDDVLGDVTAGEDDVLAGLAAGVQVRLPGWDWQDDSPP
ncbi:MAG: hypothetical protein ACLFMT_03070 [Halobacteriales archaeon]